MKKSYYGNFIFNKNNIRVLKAPPHRICILYAVGLKLKTVFHLKQFNTPNLVMNEFSLS